MHTSFYIIGLIFLIKETSGGYTNPHGSIEIDGLQRLLTIPGQPHHNRRAGRLDIIYASNKKINMLPLVFLNTALSGNTKSP